MNLARSLKELSRAEGRAELMIARMERQWGYDAGDAHRSSSPS
jgi:hypothetical protein